MQDITNYFKNKDFGLFSVVVPNSGLQYLDVKKATKLNIGCLIQCIKKCTMNKPNSQIVNNILLKINHSLVFRPPLPQRPCMIMGVEITHLCPDAKDIPSFAAVTASYDANAFKYNICWRLQLPNDKIIEDLLKLTKKQLRFFN